MKKTNIFLGIVSTILISSFAFSNSNNINPNVNKNNRYLNDEVHVSTYNELSQAVLNSDGDVIVFDNDIDLNNFNPNNVITKPNAAIAFTIDGNGYGFVNKPSKYYTTSIFEHFEISPYNTYITFRNLTLDNVGSFIDFIEITATADYDALYPNPADANLIGEGLTFQNITIKNNEKNNENIDISPFENDIQPTHMYQFMSFLVNDVFLYHSGNGTFDEAVTFSNIVIENNHIDNNTFYIGNISSNDKTIIAESFLANLEFLTCGTEDHHHHSFVTYEYIYIKNNSFTNNTFKIGNYWGGDDFVQQDFDDSIYESFGHLSGNANGLSSQVGTSGNYLMIHDIYINNNQISESKKENIDGSLVLKRYEYSELIANSNLDLETQYLSTMSLNNIFIFNNESYYLNLKGDYELYSQEDLTLLNITLLDQNNKPNTWDNLNSKNFFVYGPMYDSSKELRIFKDISGSSSINNINYGRYLFESDDAYEELVNILIENFGIYGYQIDFEQVEDNGQIKNAVSSISKVNEDHIDIFYDNLIYESEDSLIISQIELSFRFYKEFNEEQIVDVPYNITNLKLYNDQDENQDFTDSEIIATSEKIYYLQEGLYHVNLNLENEVELTQELIDNFDLNNLYLGFDYSNDSAQKESSSTILKIDPSQLKTYFPGFPDLNSGASTSVIVIGSISASILFIILIILLIILILWLLKRKRINNTVGVQDGYYEYSEDPNFLDNQDYNQNLYYEDQNDYSNYDYQDDNSSYEYEDSNYEYEDSNYDDGSNYEYEDSNYDDGSNYDIENYDYQENESSYEEYNEKDYQDNNSEEDNSEEDNYI